MTYKAYKNIKAIIIISITTIIIIIQRKLSRKNSTRIMRINKKRLCEFETKFIEYTLSNYGHTIDLTNCLCLRLSFSLLILKTCGAVSNLIQSGAKANQIKLPQRCQTLEYVVINSLSRYSIDFVTLVLRLHKLLLYSEQLLNRNPLT